MSLRDTGNWKAQLDSPISSRTQQGNRDTSNITSDDRLREYGGVSGRQALEKRRVTSLVDAILKQPPSASTIQEVRKEAVKKANTFDDIMAITKAFSDIEAYRSDVYGMRSEGGSHRRVDSYIEETEINLQTNLVEEALSHPPLQKALEKLANHGQRSEARESSPAISQTQDTPSDQDNTVKAESPENVVMTAEDKLREARFQKVKVLSLNELNETRAELALLFRGTNRTNTKKAAAVLRLVHHKQLIPYHLGSLKKHYVQEYNIIKQGETKEAKELVSQHYEILKSSLTGKNLDKYPNLKAIRDAMSASET